MQGITQQFNASHPGITIQLHLISQGSQVLAAVGAHNPPIMGEVNHYVAKLRNSGSLKSFTPYIDGKNGFTPQELSQFYNSVWTDGQVPAAGNQRYRMLVDTKVSEFLYNKDLFAKAGITTAPTTYDQLAADLALIKQKLPGVTPLALDQSIGDVFPALIANGGSLYAPGSTTKSAYNTPEATTTFNYFHTLYQKGEVIFGHTNDVRSLFAQNKLAVVDQTSAGSLPTISAVNGKFPVGAFAWPSGTSGHSGNVLQGEGIVMMTGYTQREYDAAWQFIKFWQSGKEQAWWAVHSGYAPQTRAALQYLTPQDYANNPALAVAIQTLNDPNTIHRPAADNYAQVEGLVEASFFKAVEGQQSVASALSGLQQQADAILSTPSNG
jgi:ABC-type glycerol-3-phosphate transport system substrate-binding protein